MSTISALNTLVKSSVVSTDFLLVARTSPVGNNKFVLQDLFPSVNTVGTSSETLVINITDKNVINFKGIRSLNNLLTVATASGNITLQVNSANIDLSTCNNTTSAFLSTVSLTTNVTGTLPIANGGTGATSLTANGIVVGNGTSALSTLGAAVNGQIPIGRTGLAPILGTLTAGSNITVTNGLGTITIAATVSTASSNFNVNGYNLFGAGWISGDGANEGININSSGRVFIGATTPGSTFHTGDLNINQDIYLNGANAQVIQGSSNTSPSSLSLIAASATAANAGGTLYLRGGNSVGINQGGSVIFNTGNHDGTGSSGDFEFFGYSASAVAQRILTLKGTSRYVGITNSAPSAPLDVKQDDAAANVPVIELEQLDTNESFINFVGTSGTASANSISSSTASAGAKTGAIRVKINGVTAWIRLYADAE
jgi:hypothetical protein